MAYKIAVASSDGIHIDLSFGAAPSFAIYEVEKHTFSLAEKREYILPENVPAGENGDAAPKSDAGCGEENHCGNGGGCGAGGGCQNAGGTLPKVELIRDCRCIICKKIGFNVQKQLEKLAITSFDVDCTVEEALIKITTYLEKIDNHQSLRGIQNKEA